MDPCAAAWQAPTSQNKKSNHEENAGAVSSIFVSDLSARGIYALNFSSSSVLFFFSFFFSCFSSFSFYLLFLLQGGWQVRLHPITTRRAPDADQHGSEPITTRRAPGGTPKVGGRYAGSPIATRRARDADQHGSDLSKRDSCPHLNPQSVNGARR